MLSDEQIKKMISDYAGYRFNQGAMLFARAIEKAARAQALEDAARWIDPNNKEQSQYLPNIGEPVLFCAGGVTYYGKHTGGSFKTGNGATAKEFNTWSCLWMYPPEAALADQAKGAL